MNGMGGMGGKGGTGSAYGKGAARCADGTEENAAKRVEIAPKADSDVLGGRCDDVEDADRATAAVGWVVGGACGGECMGKLHSGRFAKDAFKGTFDGQSFSAREGWASRCSCRS